MTLLDLNVSLGLIDVDASIGLISIDLAIGVNPVSGTVSDDVTAGTTGVDVIATLLGDDIIIGSDGVDVIDGGLGTDWLIFDFAGDRHVQTNVDRNLTITNLFVYTDEGLLPALSDVYSSIVGINGVVARFGATIGGVVVDTTDDSADASAFTGSEGVQLISGGGTDTFIGSANGDVFSFLMGAGTQTDGSAIGNGGDDTALIRLMVSADDHVINLDQIAGGMLIANNQGEQVGLADIAQIALTTDGMIAGGSGGTTTVNAGEATMGIFADFTDGGAITDYDGQVFITTGSGDDIIQTNAGNDIINGGAGADQMSGGAGDDIYFVDNDGDSVTELPGGGNDRVISSTKLFAYTNRFANVEAFELTGTAFQLIGNENGTELVANPLLASKVFGFAGDDTIIGGIGNDKLFGGADNDTISGGAGRDRIDGGTGLDVMRGGQGDDKYFVDNVGDTVTEFANEGNDSVRSSVNWTLGDNVENLRVRAGATQGTGNELNNQIFSVTENSVLHGLGGNDRIRGSNGADMLYGDEGNDNLNGRAGDDQVFGGTGNDLIRGRDGEDMLYGEAGVDTLIGGAGDDWLSGGSGRDTLTGDLGADIFAFADGDFAGLTAGSADRITDFDQAEGDLIDLSQIDAIFGGGDDAFTFVGDAQFTGAAGELRFEQDGGNTMVFMDVDGDMVADYAIRLDGTMNLSQADFIL